MANNNILYNAAYSGFIGGTQSRWLLSQQTIDYVAIRNEGLLFAAAMDAVIPADPNIGQQQADLLEAICESVFNGRYPIDGPLDAFDDLALSIKALYDLAVSALLPVSGSGGGDVTTYPVGTTVINSAADLPAGDVWFYAVTGPGAGGTGGARGTTRAGGISGAAGGRNIGIITRAAIIAFGFPFSIEIPTGGIGGLGPSSNGDGGNPTSPSADYTAFGPIRAYRGGNPAFGDSGAGNSQTAAPGAGGVLSAGTDGVGGNSTAKAGGQPGDGVQTVGESVMGSGGASGGLPNSGDNAAGLLDRSGRGSDSSGSGGATNASAANVNTSGGNGGPSNTGPTGGGAGACISGGTPRTAGNGGDNSVLAGGIGGTAGQPGEDGQDSPDGGITCGGTGGGGGGTSGNGGNGGTPGGGGGGGGASQVAKAGDGGNGGDGGVALLRLV